MLTRDFLLKKSGLLKIDQSMILGETVDFLHEAAK
jgi:hypothetical protein